MYIGITEGETFPLQGLLSRERYICAVIRYYICGMKFPGISEDIEKNKVKYLQLCLMLQEAPDSQIKKTLHSVLRNKIIDLNGENLHVQDMEILGNFIARSFISRTWENINLSNCKIDDKGCTVFHKELTLEDGREKPHIEKLNLSCNKICELKILLTMATECKISQLLVSKNSFKKCRYLNSHLSSYHHSTLKHLDISSNELQNYHIEYLCEGLSNLSNFKELILNDNKISDKGVKPLIKLFVQLKSFQTLECEKNCFSDYMYVKELIQYTKYLNFRRLRDLFKENKNEVCYLIIISGCIKNVPADRSNFVSNVEQLSSLSLACRNIQLEEKTNYEKYGSLADAFCFMKRMVNLTEVNLSGILIDEEAADIFVEILATHLQLLELLFLNNCGITSTIANKLGKAVQSCKTIKEIQLCKNLIDDKAIEIFLAVLHLDIKLDDNKFSSQGEFLLKLFTNYPQSITIDFSNNYYVLKSFLNVLDHVSNDSSNKAINFVNKVVQVEHLLLGLLEEQYILELQLALKTNASKIFQKIYKLSVLNFSGVIITNQAVSNLISAFKNNLQTLRYVIMNNCNINSKMVMAITVSLQNAKLIELQFCDNMIDDKAGKTLIRVLFKLDYLKVFKVKNNKLHPDSVLLFDQIEQMLLKLCDNPTDINVPFSLAIHVDKVSTKDSMLVTKIFNANNIRLLNSLSTTGSFDTCIDYFFQRFFNLKKIYLDGLLVFKGNDLCRGLHKNLHHSLQYLSISRCHLSFLFCDDLLKQIKDVSSIKEFQLCENYFYCIDEYTTLVQTTPSSEMILKCKQNNIDIICLLLSVISVKGKMTVYFSNNVNAFATEQGTLFVPHFLNQRIHLPRVMFDESSILRLNFSDTPFDQEKVNCLVQTCGTSLIFLEVLEMNNCHLNSNIIVNILPKLQIATSMKELQLCQNTISDEATKSIILNIYTWKHLEKLKLDNNNFTYHPDKLFHFVIKSSKSSDSSGNSVFCDLDSTNLDSLVTLLKYMRKFSSDSSLAEYTSLFHRQLNNLTELDLSDIPIDEQKANDIIEGCDVSLQHLQKLKMNTCSLYTKTLVIILSKLHSASNMRNLQICNNHIDDGAIKYIIIAIFQWNSFEVLKMDHNNFSYKPNKFFKFVIKTLNSSVMDLNSLYNNLNKEDVE